MKRGPPFEQVVRPEMNVAHKPFDDMVVLPNPKPAWSSATTTSGHMGPPSVVTGGSMASRGVTAGGTIVATLHDVADIQQNRSIGFITTVSLYNKMKLKMENAPEFYTGVPVDPVDLRFRGEFVEELWQRLRTGHVVLTAPRRTGKTSVMDYLRDHPENGFKVV